MDEKNNMRSFNKQPERKVIVRARSDMCTTVKVSSTLDSRDSENIATIRLNTNVEPY